MAKDDDKSVWVYQPIECDQVWRHRYRSGRVDISFRLPDDHDLVLQFSPSALASLEAKLQEIRDDEEDDPPLQ